MEINVQPISWDQQGSLKDLFSQAKSQRVDYLIIQQQSGSLLTLAMDYFASQSDIIAFRDPSETQRWNLWNQYLPPSTYFVAALPSEHLSIAISVESASANAPLLTKSGSLCEFVIHLAKSASTVFFDNVLIDFVPKFHFPSLSTKGVDPQNSWLGEIIQQISISPKQNSPTSVAAIKAGLFLLNDFADDSHSWSQSIEGLGTFHTGDYWHAILHRREPDYGNAKYWFRNVGRHPVFNQLAANVTRRLDESRGTLALKLKPWASRLIAHDRWDPFGFVDLCAAAENDSELQAWCEEVQYEEMRLLLESTAREAMDAQ